MVTGTKGQKSYDLRRSPSVPQANSGHLVDACILRDDFVRRCVGSRRGSKWSLTFARTSISFSIRSRSPKPMLPASRCSVRADLSPPTTFPGAFALSTAPTTTCSTPSGALPTTRFPRNSAPVPATSWTTLDRDGPRARSCQSYSGQLQPGQQPEFDVLTADPHDFQSARRPDPRQSLRDPDRLATGRYRAPADQMAVTAQISAAYAPLIHEFKAVADAARAMPKPAAASASPGNAALQAAAAAAAARSRKCGDRPGCSG